MREFRPHLVLFGLFLLALSWPQLMIAAPTDSCDCPKINCDPCLEEQGLTFYSEKCGPDGSKVKSCARPTCVPMANPPSSCNKPQATSPATSPNEGKDAKAQGKAAERGPEIATVKGLEGNAWLKLPGGDRLAVSMGSSVHEKDTLETEGSGKVHLEFKDGNLMQVQNSSMMKVDQYEMAAEKRKAVIDLLRGQIRNQVKQKYNGQTSTFQIRTKTAVAGVRGTDFVATYKEGEKVETEIKTLEGKVVLANLDYSQSLEVSKGEQAAYVVSASNVFNQDEIDEFVARGYMTPVYKMSDAELRKLDTTTQVGERADRQVASLKKQICSSPKAELNQCAWRCENNPKGEKTCRSDLPQVNCVRKRCNANGEWAEEARMPAGLREQCAATGLKVAPCDY